MNGINSYITSFDGFDKFYDSLCEICKGRKCVSPAVLERINLRREYPMPAGKITDKHIQVIRLICNGFKDLDIADTLHISRSTVDNHKTDIFVTLNVRNSNELIRAALTLGIMQLDEICFFPKNFTVNPKPQKNTMKRRVA